DATRQYVTPTGVDVPTRGTEASPEARDDAIRDSEIGLEHVGRRRDDGIPDDRIELRHGCSFSRWTVRLRRAIALQVVDGPCRVHGEIQDHREPPVSQGASFA